MKINKINSAILCSKNSVIKTQNLGGKKDDLPVESLTKTPPLIPISFLGKPNKYLNELAIGLTKELGEKVKPSQLKSVMTKEEFLKEIPKLTEQNFVASPENIKNGVFIADLHCHTNYSDGRISVQSMLDQAVEYGNKLKNINGKKFIFALSDHDGINGVVDALKIIAKNPQKYENVKFVPASELSFVVHCEEGSKRNSRYQTNVQMPEALIYNINPFSETSKIFFNDLYSNRKKQTESMIKEANELMREGKFSVKELNSFAKGNKESYFMMNEHWRVLDYIASKLLIVESAKKNMKNVEEQKREVLSYLQANNLKIHPYYVNKFLCSKGLIKDTKNLTEILNKIAQKYFPYVRGGNAMSACEHTFDDVVNYAQKEDAQLALAHPVYFLQNFKQEDGYQRLCEYIKKSKGRLNFAEKYHQAYHIGKQHDIQSERELNEYNKILDRCEFVNIGGRDNHSLDFAKFQDVTHVGGRWN